MQLGWPASLAHTRQGAAIQRAAHRLVPHPKAMLLASPPPLPPFSYSCSYSDEDLLLPLPR